MSRITTILLAICILLVAGSVTWVLQRENSREGIRSADSPSPSLLPPSSLAIRKPAASRWSKLTEDNLLTYQRLEIARQISDSLSQDDTAALFAAMDHRPRSGAEEDWYLIFNEILEQMRRHGLGSDRYATHLGKIITDPNRPEVVRDYAIQHLLLWIAPGRGEQAVPHEENPEIIQQSLQSIVATIQDPSLSQSAIPGTALLALANISQNLPQENAKATWNSLELHLQAIISGDGPMHLPTKVSAIQAVAVTGQQKFHSTIRDLATNEATDPSIRLSSIASLGFYSDPADQALLKTLATEDTLYRYAAQSALQRLGLP